MPSPKQSLYITDLVGRVQSMLADFKMEPGKGRPSKHSSKPNLMRISKMTGIDYQDIRKYAKGVKVPNTITADRILDSLGMTVLDLLTNDEIAMKAAGVTHARGTTERIFLAHWADGMTNRGEWDCPCGVCRKARKAGIDPGAILLKGYKTVDETQ